MFQGPAEAALDSSKLTVSATPLCMHTFSGMVWRGMHVFKVKRCWRFDRKPDFHAAFKRVCGADLEGSKPE